ncbi:Testis-expressed protein 19.2 [Camelus dromedarius]|uniref:Testis-expressed protein 19 n=4 Tax=Camelus TaxID=9836 RepID=A0A8B8UJ01_CAMFR|nr:testis-expressed protein 19.2-like [Camelus dromedarius]XP_031325631.1 testis-expressed protein 19.2-like [Camelus dromedarius]XP_032354090.1 testis-expressed protein 19.2-like [Camelus ferus]XP_032354091.1 testis-expressed protein 19.2-like [Camelus ferus]XP_032354092.1 testis-expressed protein 19 [Camelus ferus]XP_032354093.1 testis-expressed protein 19 [Camelus ferus]XP_032354094.1 testis-expressed protein 19 [Camelus ferus]KAB1265428.1 Testis-expressed protein 19.2 [Camelus dromedariu
MCAPVSLRHEAEGMSYLHASWVYQLQHGDQLRVCFACFKAAFLDFKEFLEEEDWEDEDWNPELVVHTGAGSELGASPGVGPGWGQAQGGPAQGGAVAWGPDPLGAGPVGYEEVGLDHYFVPTELEPQNAVPLGLGPEDADWVQGLPWRLGRLPTCSHWPCSSLPWQGFLRVDLPPGAPMVLELGTTQAVDPAEAEAWLLGLQVICMVGFYDAIYFRKMKPTRALRTPGQRWKLVLEPNELWVVRLQDAPQVQDLHRWQLSILESSPPAGNEELVPADSALLKRGFSILSFSPWAQREAEEGDSAPGPQPSSRGGDPGPSGPRGPGEGLAVPGASAPGELPCFQPFGPGPQN